jgi:hypothetical protein
MNEDIEQILNNWVNSKDLYGDKNFKELDPIKPGQRLFKLSITLDLNFGDSGKPQRISKMKYYGTFFDNNDEELKFEIDNQQLEKTIQILEKAFIDELSSAYDEALKVL